MDLQFDKTNGLIPVIIQDYQDGSIYMLGYMNKEALNITMKTGRVYFWSRKTNKLWMKGETSGNTLLVKKILSDCDGDTLLVMVDLEGKNVCHTGNKTCFFRTL
jgi:phosphoribosyl-AMP cyclohydrolase